MFLKELQKPRLNRRKQSILEATVMNDGGGKQGGASISSTRPGRDGAGAGVVISARGLTRLEPWALVDIAPL